MLPHGSASQAAPLQLTACTAGADTDCEVGCSPASSCHGVDVAKCTSWCTECSHWQERHAGSCSIQHTLAPCRWDRPPAAKTLRQVAAATEGYAGADLQGLCTAAVLAAVRRQAPLLTEDMEAMLADQAADEQQQAAAGARQVDQPPAEQGRLGSGEQQAAAATTLDRRAPAGLAREEQQGLLLAARQALPPDEQLQQHGMEAVQPREVAVGLNEQLQQQDAAPAELDPVPGTSAALRLGEPREAVQLTPAVRDTQQQEATHAAAAPAAPTSGGTAQPGNSSVRPAARPALQRTGLSQAVRVKVGDWRRALQEAPPPCCRREGTGFLRQAPACPLPWHLAPVLLPHLAALLQSCGHSSVAGQYPLLGAAAAAAAAASRQPAGVQEGAHDARDGSGPAAAEAGNPQDLLQQLEHTLQGLGLVQGSPRTGGAPRPVLFNLTGCMCGGSTLWGLPTACLQYGNALPQIVEPCAVLQRQ